MGSRDELPEFFTEFMVHNHGLVTVRRRCSYLSHAPATSADIYRTDLKSGCLIPRIYRLRGSRRLPSPKLRSTTAKITAFQGRRCRLWEPTMVSATIDD
jgi:hypothetical protein